MKGNHKKFFWIAFSVVCAVFLSTIIAYRITFDGDISNDSNDWANFATFVASIGTMLFTALNALVFYLLTSTFNDWNYQSQRYEKQRRVVNQFNNNIRKIFILDPEGTPMCDIHPQVFQDPTSILQWLKGLKIHKDILPTLGGNEYDNFIKEFIEFYDNHFHPFTEDSATMMRYEDYMISRLYSQAIHLENEMYKDLMVLP